MIRTYRDRDTERLASRQRVKKWPPELSRAALRKLRMLDAAEELTGLRVPPRNRLEGDRQGRYSIRINDQWHICFRFDGGSAYDVGIVDYHGEVTMTTKLPAVHPRGGTPRGVPRTRRAVTVPVREGHQRPAPAHQPDRP